MLCGGAEERHGRWGVRGGAWWRRLHPWHRGENSFGGSLAARWPLVDAPHMEGRSRSHTGWQTGGGGFESVRSIGGIIVPVEDAA